MPHPTTRKVTGCQALPYQLNGNHENRLERESSVTQVEQILQAGPQQLQHHSVVLPARPKVVHLGDALCEEDTGPAAVLFYPAPQALHPPEAAPTCSAELLVEAVLQVQLWRPGLDGLLGSQGHRYSESPGL